MAKKAKVREKLVRYLYNRVVVSGQFGTVNRITRDRCLTILISKAIINNEMISDHLWIKLGYGCIGERDFSKKEKLTFSGLVNDYIRCDGSRDLGIDQAFMLSG